MTRPSLPRFVRTAFAAALFALAAGAQQAETITEARVREIVEWLAHDDRGGRDTPSPGLEAAAEWLAARFASAGLQQVQKSTWFHDYTLPGLELDSTAVRLVLRRKVANDEPTTHEFVADADVRLWRQGDVTEGQDDGCTVADAGDPVLQRLLFAQSGRQTTVVEVAEDHPFWTAAKGKRRALQGRRASARPVLLVRKGILPPPPDNGLEAVWAASWATAAPEKTELPLKNVVSLLPGTDKKDEFVVVSAHYDHVGTGNPVDGDGIYNGADDDATGTTAVVLLAEALAQGPAPRRSILFVCFSAEEKGLLGSAAFVERPPVPKEQIVANLNLEMLGRPEPGKQGKAWITGADLSDFAAIAGPAMQRAGVEIVEFPMAGRLFAASDNYSFVKKGIVAHSISAGSLHADYHKPSDEVDLLDIPHMTNVIRALRHAVLDFANREERPAWNDKGRQHLERLRR